MAEYVWKQTPMRQLTKEERLKEFSEVLLGYSYEQALAEADRCLQCQHPFCQDGCPAHNPIKEYIRLFREGDIEGAIRIDRESNVLMACTGRVCDWEHQCEGACVMGVRGEPVRIGAIERFLADYQHFHPELEIMELPPLKDEKVAVIGAGPAGLACAQGVRLAGYQAEIFDAWYLPGGVMSYGIPQFVLQQDVIDREVDILKKMGIKFHHGVVIGKDMTIDDLFAKGFKAVFVGVGANKAKTMGIEGEDLEGVYTAKDFLMFATQEVLTSKYNLPTVDGFKVGKKVAVIGAGNTAMDAARTAIRMGAEEVKIVYRRSKEQSPSREIEIEHTEHEGVKFEYLVNPLRILGDENGRVKGMESIRMKLGSPDRSGRPRPEPVEGSEFIMDVDQVVFAVGYDPETLIAQTTPGLEVNSWNGIVVDNDTYMTSREGVFAGGDSVTGANTVVHAVAAGRDAAQAIINYLED